MNPIVIDLYLVGQVYALGFLVRIALALYLDWEDLVKTVQKHFPDISSMSNNAIMLTAIVIDAAGWPYTLPKRAWQLTRSRLSKSGAKRVSQNMQRRYKPGSSAASLLARTTMLRPNEDISDEETRWNHYNTVISMVYDCQHSNKIGEGVGAILWAVEAGHVVFCQDALKQPGIQSLLAAHSQMTKGSA